MRKLLVLAGILLVGCSADNTVEIENLKHRISVLEDRVGSMESHISDVASRVAREVYTVPIEPARDRGIVLGEIEYKCIKNSIYQKYEGFWRKSDGECLEIKEVLK